MSDRYKAVVKGLAALVLLRRAAGDSFTRHTRFWSSAGVAIAIVLSYVWRSKKAKLISDASKVGRKVTDAEQDSEEFDIIIAGGGTAGCVLASRLSEDPSIKVLLLEAGSSGKALVFSRMPTAFAELYHTRHVYELHTTPQFGTTKFWPRARLLGGCSSINAQIAQYGAPSDFDEWAEIIGDDSWKFEKFRKYINKFENFVPDQRFPEVDATKRGSTGPVTIGYNGHFNTTAMAFVKTCQKAGMPLNPDFNTISGTKGVNRVMTYINKKGQRVSTESAYLTDDVLARPNLTVAINARVTRIVFDEVAGETRAVGVEFANSETGPRYRARARKEVIVSGGAIHSPHILMLSGVGPAEHLKEHGIPIVHDLPGVGSHLIDHPCIQIRYRDSVGVSSSFLRPLNSVTHIPKLISALARYAATGTGPLASNVGEALAFCRTDDPVLFPPAEYPEQIEDSNSGPESPDIEFIYTPIAVTDHENLVLGHLQTCSILVILLRPTSKGTVRLKSANPWELPAVDPNYCHTQHDVKALVRGVKKVLEVARIEPLASTLDHSDKHPELDHALHLKTDAELADIVRQRVDTIYHPSSSCRMAPLEQGGVVDSHLRVYGIPNLRVCDVSTFPWLISGHPTGACIASAERLADIIKAQLK